MNFFGALGQLGRILPGYIEGRRAAIQDNWQDLQNYNNVQHGQLQNAFDLSTWNPQVSNEYVRAGMLQLAGLNSGLNWANTLAQQPALSAAIGANNANAGALANANIQNTLMQNQLLSAVLRQMIQSGNITNIGTNTGTGIGTNTGTGTNLQPIDLGTAMVRQVPIVR